MNFIKKLIISFAALAVMVASAIAGEQDFKFANLSRAEIKNLYISAANNNYWGGDVLGRNVLDYGQQTDILFPDAASATYWDIKVVLANGRSLIFNGLNLKRIFKIAFYWDDDRGEYRVGYEYN